MMYLLLIWAVIGLSGYIFCINQQNKRYNMHWSPADVMMGCLAPIAGPFVLLSVWDEVNNTWR